MVHFYLEISFGCSISHVWPEIEEQVTKTPEKVKSKHIFHRDSKSPTVEEVVKILAV